MTRALVAVTAAVVTALVGLLVLHAVSGTPRPAQQVSTAYVIGGE